MSSPPSPAWFDRAIVFLAQGFGSGRLPAGPGTWGSVVGVLWLLILLAPGVPMVWAIVVVLSVLVAVAVCTRAETVLGQHDPSSVVLDEIVAVPLTFLGPWAALGAWPVPHPTSLTQLAVQFWPELLTGFVAFRVFDIWKPGPIGRVQRLPRGWGVVADDVLAGLAAAVVTGVLTWARHR